MMIIMMMTMIMMMVVMLAEMVTLSIHLLGAVHILRQPKTGVRRPPPPSVSKCQLLADPPSPLVSFCQQLADPPSPLRQLSSAFGKRPICTTNFTEDFLK